MLQSFACKETEKLFKREKNFIPAQIQKIALRKLLMLHAATILDQLKIPPNNKLHALTHDRKGQHAICVNNQYRICFKWQSGHAYEVEIIDYH